MAEEGAMGEVYLPFLSTASATIAGIPFLPSEVYFFEIGF